MSDEKLTGIFNRLVGWAWTGKYEDEGNEFSEDEEKAIKEIRRLIESSGEAEVGDEERERLDKHFIDLTDPTHWSACSLCSQIRALIRQPKRTVSREQFKEWSDSLFGHSLLRTKENFFKILAELAYTVEDKNG